MDTARIFTSQGWLGDAIEDPGIDLIMNLFRIPRVFAVGGFDGTWSVAKHSFLTAFLAVFWGRERKWPAQKRDRFVVMALVHDLHESVTGDILPTFKVPEVKDELNRLQAQILDRLGIEVDDSVKDDLKLMDLIAFLYEIKQVPVDVLNTKKIGYAREMYNEQMGHIMTHCAKCGISKKTVKKFLKDLGLAE